MHVLGTKVRAGAPEGVTCSYIGQQMIRAAPSIFMILLHRVYAAGLGDAANAPTR